MFLEVLFISHSFSLSLCLPLFCQNVFMKKCVFNDDYPICVYIYMVFITEGLFEVAIESWPEWDLNQRPLNSVQML